MKAYAVRNIRLCTKDCLCLYVCPVGATNTETGQIDDAKCIGCGDCAAACPSHAISMVPKKMPPQQKKEPQVADILHLLAQSKALQEQIAMEVAQNTDDLQKRRFVLAIAKSNRLMAEDLLRESGYMLPQSLNTHHLLRSMLENPPEDFPIEAVKQLLQQLSINE